MRIGLYNKYNYKKLVNDLDELINEFLFDSNGEIIKSKANKETKTLVTRAIRNYEIINKPKYLIDRNAFRSALSKKIKKILNRPYNY